MERSTPFIDRRDAGKKLAAALKGIDLQHAVVVALPRGGVPVAEEICRAYHLPLDLILVRKIGVPAQPELAAGAIVDGAVPHVVINHSIARAYGLTDAAVEAMGQALLPEIERRRAVYFVGLERPSLHGKTVIVVDDGIATGATLRAALQALSASGAAEIVLAVPVASPNVLPQFKELADRIICLAQPTDFRAVGAAYRHFGQTSDSEVVAALKRLAPQ